jgi:hypothetical protein
MPDAHQSANNDDLRKRVLPDPAICRARFIGYGAYGECLVDHAFECKFAISFGEGFICHHPEVRAIADRTADPQQPRSDLS